MDTTDTVGVIGLGIIGSRVAENLMKAGRKLAVWNRTPRQHPAWQNSPAAVAEQALVIQLFVTDGPALHEVVAAMSPALTPNHVVLNHGTVSLAATQKAAEMVAATGAASI